MRRFPFNRLAKLSIPRNVVYLGGSLSSGVIFYKKWFVSLIYEWTILVGVVNGYPHNAKHSPYRNQS